MIPFPLSGETCRHLAGHGAGFLRCDDRTGAELDGQAGSRGSTPRFPIPPHVCRHLRGFDRPHASQFSVRHVGRTRSSWPVRWGRTWLNGCADFSGPRQGAVDEAMVACYPFLGSPVVTPGGTIGVINEGNCPEQSVRLYRFRWMDNRLDFCGMEVVHSPVSNPVLIGLGDKQFFGATTQGFLQAGATNEETEVLPHPVWRPYALAPDLESVVFLGVEEAASSFHRYRIEDKTVRHDVHRLAFRPPVRGNSGPVAFAPPGGMMVVSASPAAWDAYFALEPARGSYGTTCDLLYACLRQGHAPAAVTVIQRAIRRADSSPDPLANIHLMADPNEGVSVWESAVPPIALPGGQVAVLRGRVLRITPNGPGVRDVDQSISLPGGPYGAVVGMVGDADGWIYVAAGSTLVAIDPTPQIAWTADCGDQITSEPVPVAPGVIIVTAGRRVLWIA